MSVIVKLGKFYVPWSTIVDAPLTPGLTKQELREFILREAGEQGLAELPMRLERVDAIGTSSMLDDSAESVVKFNRAGPDKSEMSFDDLVVAAAVQRRKYGLPDFGCIKCEHANATNDEPCEKCGTSLQLEMKPTRIVTGPKGQKLQEYSITPAPRPPKAAKR